MSDSLEGPFGIVMTRLAANSTLLGMDEGAIPYGSERPRHEVRIKQRWISPQLISNENWANVLSQEMPEGADPNQPVDRKTWPEIEAFLSEVSERAEEMGIEGDWRLPSESEWQLANEDLDISVPRGLEELLADHPHPNHRGAPTDGRPRQDTNPHSMMRLYRISRKSHPTREGFSVKSQAPVKNPQEDKVFRLVLIPPFSEGPDILVPEDVDVPALMKREVLIALVVGILPSFAIPMARGFSSYLVDGWPNLVFGGLILSLVTAFLWRPRTATWVFDESGEALERRWLKGGSLK